MASNAYLRPDLDQAYGVLPMYVTGALPSARPSGAYEGRLAIHNAIGSCTVEQIAGDALPPGSALYVDGAQVVVAWPAYSATSAPIANGNFELGDTGWLRGAGWSIEHTDDHNDGQHETGFGSFHATYRGQGTSIMEGAAFYQATPGQVFSAQVNVQQGASSRHNCGAQIGVRFYDAAKVLISEQLGSMMDDGSGGAWHLSTGSFQTPANAKLVRPLILGMRVRQNLPLWVDDASWGLQATVGITFETVINLTLRVRDGAGRTALWNGSVVVIYAGWNPADVGYGTTVSLDRMSAFFPDTIPIQSATVRGVPGRSSGKWYLEYTCYNAPDNTANWHGGIAPMSWRVDVGIELGIGSTVLGNIGVSFSSHGYCYNNNVLGGGGARMAGPPYPGTTNAVTMLAWDADTGNLWIGVNGVWKWSGNPAAGTNPPITGALGEYFPGASMVAANSASDPRFCKLYGTASTISYTPPAGFKPWFDG